MTRDEILNMEAGRELDALVAEKVMSEELIIYIPNVIEVTREMAMDAGDLSMEGALITQAAWEQIEPAPYSTDIAAAWEVVEKMEAKDIWFDASSLIPNSDPVVYDFAFHGVGLHNAHVWEDTLPLAICRAALLAVMEEERT